MLTSIFSAHLGLVEPDIIRNAHDPVTSFMRPAPIPNDPEDDQGPRRRAEYITVIDPLSDEFQVLWDSVAQTNRSVYTEVFRAIPSDLVRSWAQYKVHLQSSYTAYY
jgi:phospholipase D1/2